MLATLAQFGIDGGLVEGRTGVWVGHEKIGAIGVKISGGIAYHGLALNVCPDLSYFQHISPLRYHGRGCHFYRAPAG